MAGVLLQDFLACVHPGSDRARLRGIQARGGVRVNGMVAERNLRLLAHDFVELLVLADDLGGRQQAPPAPPLRVLYESTSALVVDKPAGEVTVPDRSGASGVHGRLADLRPEGDLRIVHRLDRDTSGCLCLAKGLEAARHFDAEFRARRVHKSYIALVTGVVRRAEQAVTLFLGPDPRRPGKVVTARTQRKGFRAARTIVRAVGSFAEFTLVQLVPETGRGHQLRAHLAAISHPIVGDADYGGRPLLLSEHKRGYKLRRGVAERPMLSRMFLHSERIEFREPDGGSVAVTAPLPDDLRLALAKIVRFGQRRASRN